MAVIAVKTFSGRVGYRDSGDRRLKGTRNTRINIKSNSIGAEDFEPVGIH